MMTELELAACNAIRAVKVATPYATLVIVVNVDDGAQVVATTGINDELAALALATALDQLQNDRTAPRAVPPVGVLS